MASDSRRAVYREGPEAAERFTGLLGNVLNVSKDELTKREASYRKQRAKKRTKKPGHR